MLEIETAPVLIPVIRITNPFNLREFVREEIAWSPTKTLLDYFPIPSVELMVSVNGKIIEQVQFGQTYLDKTDNLVICPVLHSGGDGKSVLRMVAMIAVAYFTGGAGSGWLVGSGSLTGATGFAASMVSAGAMIAGSMLINSIFASPVATKDATSTTSSYGVDGAKNTSIESIPVPICYGAFRMGGNILGLHVNNDADDNQTLFILLSAGEGPVFSLSDLEVNDNPISDYLGVEVQTRLGEVNQTAIPWFNDTVVSISKGQKLTTDWFYSTTTTAVDKVRLDFVAPQGLCAISLDSGNSVELAVDLVMEYREAETSDAWLPMPTLTEVGSWVGVLQMSRPTTVVASVDFYGEPTYEQELYWVDEATGAEVTDVDALEYLKTAPTTVVQVANGGAGGNSSYSFSDNGFSGNMSDSGPNGSSGDNNGAGSTGPGD